MEGVHIVFENSLFYILAKDHGVACQSKTQNDIETAFGSAHFITRLDQPAAGLLVLAKNSESAALLSEAMNKGLIQKKYVALVEGVDVAKSGQLAHQLSKKGSKATAAQNHTGKSLLRYFVNEVLERYTMLDIKIDTGKFHQIRVQLSSAGMPIKGDLKYGAKRSNKEGGIYLCCKRITLPDPETGLPLEWSINMSDFSLPLWKFYKE